MDCPTCGKEMNKKAAGVVWLVDDKKHFCSRGCIPPHPRPIVDGKVICVKIAA